MNRSFRSSLGQKENRHVEENYRRRGAPDRNGAAIGGLLGAVVGSSLPANNGYYNQGYSNGGYVDNRASYYDNRGYSESYYAPAPVYVEPRPVYYAPAPVYYSQPSTVLYVGGGGYYGHGYHGGYYGHRR